MPELGKYAFEVLLAYGVSLGLLAVIGIIVALRAMVASRRLSAAENRLEPR